VTAHWSDAPPDRVLTMPPGPSTNALWVRAAGKPRTRSPEYTAWLHVAGWEVRRQMIGVPMVECRFNCQLSVPISRRDSDNWVKASLDLLQHTGVISNDGNLHQLAVTPMERDDVMVALWMLPEMLGVRPAATRHRLAAVSRSRTGKGKGKELTWILP
jgi:Holliday junction resolvase RusA-like endonuclease